MTVQTNDKGQPTVALPDVFQIRFAPEGTDKTERAWARLVRQRGDITTWLKLRDDGSEWHREGDTLHVIVGTADTLATAKPARMNLHYARLELVS